MTAPQGNGWGRFWLGLLVPITAFLVGYGVLKEQVRDVRDDVLTRAPREVVEAQNREVLRSLEALRQDIQDLRRQLGAQP